MTGVYAKRALLILAVVALVVEGYFVYRWYDRYSGVASDTTSGGVAPLEGTMLDGTAPEETTAMRGVPSDAADTVADRGVAASQRAEAQYVDAVEEIQTDAVETFRDSHEKLLRYDALSAADVEEMGDNETALRSMSARAADLVPPQKYEEQHGAFVAAIDELREAAGLAHAMSADPVAVTDTAFDEYDGRVGEASALLRRSNDLLGEQYETIGGVREVSPEF